MNDQARLKLPLILIAAVGTQIFLILADVIFVAYYAILSNPGQEQSVYDQFALDTAGAFVFCFAPLWVYTIVTWVCNRAGSLPFQHALLLVAAYYVIDVAIVALVAFDQIGEIFSAPMLVNGAMMLTSATIAAWHWQKKAAPPTLAR